MKHRKTKIPHKYPKKNISQQHKEKQNLQNLELRQYRTMFDSMADTIHLVDTDLRIIMVNKAFKKWGKQLGLDTNVTGRKLLDVCPFLSRKVLDEYKTVFRTGKIVVTEERNKFGDSEIFTETRKIPVFEENKAVRIITIIQNITKRKKAEEALQKSEERFRQVVENAQEWIWEVDANGLYTYASPIGEKILGYKPEEIVKKKYFYDLFQSEGRERLKKEAFEVFAKKKSFREFINQNIHKNGEPVWLSTSGVPLLDEKGNLLGYRGADTNITERKKIEEMKDNLIRDISHGLKSPIAMTEMAFSIFQEGLQNGNIEQIQQAERIASSNLRKIRKDVNNMLEIFTLDMRRMIEKKKHKISLKPVINEIIKNMRYLIEEKGLKLIVDISQGGNKVLIGKRDIKTLIYDIMDNAIKFTEHGSISIKIRPKGKMVRIDVKDTGCGIEEEHKDKVFDKFYKRHAAIEGSGLGLSICKEIVQMYKGEIKINSKGTGKGTTVTVLLPKG